MSRAVIFDLDGVISDTQKIHSRLESEVLAEFGVHISPEEMQRRFAGMSGKDVIPLVFREAGLQCPDLKTVTRLKNQRFLTTERFDGIPGTRDVILRLREAGVLLAVASGSRFVAIRTVLSRLKLTECFAAITSSQEVARGKPAPDVFLLTATRLGLSPAQCVVVEDSVAGMEAANSARMRCVGLVQEAIEKAPCDLLVRDLREVSIDWFLL